MDMLIKTFSNKEWQQIGAGLTSAVLVAKGLQIEFYVSPDAPAALDAGLPLKSGDVFYIPEIALLGGDLWVRSLDAQGSIRYTGAPGGMGMFIDPVDLPNVDAVHDPWDISTLFQDAAGTIPVTQDGDPVGRVVDRTGNGYDLTAPSDAERPTYRRTSTKAWLHVSLGQKLQSAQEVPFSDDVFVALAFRTLRFDTAFPSIYNSRGQFNNQTANRQPLIFSRRDEPERISVSWGTRAMAPVAPESLLNKDVVLSTWTDNVTSYVDINGVEGSIDMTSSPMTDPGVPTEGIEISDPNDSDMHWYGACIARDVPSAENRAFIREFYAMRSGYTA